MSRNTNPRDSSTVPQPLKLYLESRESSVAESTLYSHQQRLKRFFAWLQSAEPQGLSQLEPLHIHEFRVFRREQGNLSKATEKTEMDTLRVFLRWCEKMDLVDKRLSEAVQSPTLSKSENSRDEVVRREEQDAIEEHLNTYDYASTHHAYVCLLRTGIRLSAIHACDVDDFEPDERTLELKHRPSEETPLKNQAEGERVISLGEHYTEVLRDYIEQKRPEVEDEYGRAPLVATAHGRVHDQTLRSWSYELTRTCEHGLTGGTTCMNEKPYESAYACPDARSPHTWRRGTITWLLNENSPTKVVSGRCDVSTEVIEQHYDERTENEKMEARREWLDEL